MIYRDDLYDHDGPAPAERVDATPDDTRRLAQAIVDQTVEDLADRSRRGVGARRDAEEWLAGSDPDGRESLDLCAQALGKPDTATLVAEIRRAARERLCGQAAHRDDIRAAHDPNALTLRVGDEVSRSAHLAFATLVSVAMRGEWP